MSSRSSRPPTDPVAGLTTPAAALVVVTAIVGSTPGDQIVCLLLDHGRRVVTVFSVTEITDPDDVLTVADCALRAAGGDTGVEHMMLVSVRCAAAGPDTPEGRGPSQAELDLDRWCLLDDRCNDAGVELVEWFVITPRRVVLPRERLGAPARWQQIDVGSG